MEFLVDRSGEFYFLEMNTRLQVEHTITEMVTGHDLVEWQLRIATGEELTIDAVEPRGTPSSSASMPRTHTTNFSHARAGGRVAGARRAGVRVDSWIRPGTNVSRYYDNLMAKLIVWAPDRARAIQKGRRALEEFRSPGVASTIPAHLAVLNHPDFINGTHHTKWMEENVDLGGGDPEATPSLPGRGKPVSARHHRRGRGSSLRSELLGAGAVDWQHPQETAAKLRLTGPVSASDGMVTAPMQGTIVESMSLPGRR